jgi:hypothetical protein
MDSGTVEAIGISVAVSVVGLLAYKAWQAAGAAAGAVGDVVTHQLNPASSDNLVNAGVTSVGAAVSGDTSWTLGGWLYDVTGGNDKVAAMLKGAPTPPAANAGTYDPLINYLGPWPGSGASGGW